MLLQGSDHQLRSLLPPFGCRLSKSTCQGLGHADGDRFGHGCDLAAGAKSVQLPAALLRAVPEPRGLPSPYDSNPSWTSRPSSERNSGMPPLSSAALSS